MTSFRSIEKNDQKARCLIWILDLGRQIFDDTESRMRFLNVQALMCRLKALKNFEDSEADERWRWLLSRAVIVLLDTRAIKEQKGYIRYPTFSAHNVSLTTLEPTWIDSPMFHELYGDKLERLKQRLFTVFLRSESDWVSPSEWGRSDLRYFGYASFPTDKLKLNFQGRGLELPPLPIIYAEAFRAVCAAAAHVLDLTQFASKPAFVGGEDATQQLCYLGYRILRIDEFMENY
jgi:hypothetical protein